VPDSSCENKEMDVAEVESDLESKVPTSEKSRSSKKTGRKAVWQD